MTTCNWFWGSHGCDLTPNLHEGDHVCGSRHPDGPCCRWSNGTVVWINPDGTESEPAPYSGGFCLNGRPDDPPCGDPENCSERDRHPNPEPSTPPTMRGDTP